MSNNRPGQKAESRARARLRAVYNQLWSEAISRIRAGKPELDPVLQAGLPDRRRGLTVVARPSLAVRQRIAAFLQELRQLEPGQYYYTALEFHLTVLSLVSATTDFEPLLARRDRYVSAVDAALSNGEPVCIDFEGVTASPGTVMLQGWFENDTLNRLRDVLRSRLRNHGLGAELDRRYRLRTAHMTVVRFRKPLRDAERFAAVLERARRRSFGATTFKSLSLVENDWYLSRRATKIVKRYRLGRNR